MFCCIYWLHSKDPDCNLDCVVNGVVVAGGGRWWAMVAGGGRWWAVVAGGGCFPAMSGTTLHALVVYIIYIYIENHHHHHHHMVQVTMHAFSICDNINNIIIQ